MDTSWLNMDSAIKYLGIGKTTLYELVQSNKIPVSKVGKLWKFEKHALDEWLRANKSIETFFLTINANIEDNLLLREPQREGYNSAYNYLKSGHNEALLQIPVGCGKSGLISILPFGIAKGRVLVIAPNIQIKNELYDALDIANKQKCFWIKSNVLADEDMIAGPYVCSLEETNMSVVEKAHFIVTNVQQLSLNADKWLNKFDPSYFDMIIVDEAHHNVADSWQRVFNKFPHAKVINLTATPFRSDKQELKGTLIYKYSFKSAAIRGYIKKLRASYVVPNELTFTAKGETRTYTKEEVLEMKDEEWFSKGIALSKVCNESIVNNSLEKLEELRQTGTRHQLIAVACSIDHAKEIQALYMVRGYNTEIIHSKLPEEDKVRIVRELKSGVLDCIVQVQMLGEGFDHPKLSIAAIFRPFRSLNPYIQFVGRILRVIVQNDPQHPDNKGYIVTHIGLNQEEHVKNFRDFESDDKAFWEEAISQETQEEVEEGRKQRLEYKRILPTMEVHNEIVEDLFEEDFTQHEDYNAVKQTLINTFESLGLDSSKVEDILRKEYQEPTNIVKASKGFKKNIQIEWKMAKKRLNDQVKHYASIVLHNTKLSVPGRELIYQLDIGIEATNNLIAVIQLLNQRVNKAIGKGKKREEWRLEDFEKARSQLPAFSSQLVRQIKKLQSNGKTKR